MLVGSEHLWACLSRLVAVAFSTLHLKSRARACLSPDQQRGSGLRVLRREKSSVEKDQDCIISISFWHLFKLGDFSYFSEGNNLLSFPPNLFSDRSLNSPIRSLSDRSADFSGRMFTKDSQCCQEKRENENDRVSEGQFQRQWDLNVDGTFFLLLTGCPKAGGEQRGVHGASGFPVGEGPS